MGGLFLSFYLIYVDFYVNIAYNIIAKIREVLFVYTAEQLTTLSNILDNASIRIEKQNIYGGKPTSTKCEFNRLFIDDGKLFVEYKETSSSGSCNNKYRLKYILDNLGVSIKSNSSNLTNMKKYIENSDKKFGPALREFIDGGLFMIDSRAPQLNEVEWLKAHVRRIRAQVPLKLEYSFKRQFPGQTYEARKDQWAFGFTLFFDEVDDIPASLLSIKNKNDNSIDLDSKSFSNTSYIARLVKNYPEYFYFGTIK